MQARYHTAPHPELAVSIRGCGAADKSGSSASYCLMLLAFLSLVSGLILDTVSQGRREMKRLHYLQYRPPGR